MSLRYTEIECDVFVGVLLFYQHPAVVSKKVGVDFNYNIIKKNAVYVAAVHNENYLLSKQILSTCNHYKFNDYKVVRTEILLNLMCSGIFVRLSQFSL